jgi:3-deoxy-manno-octulosonate cytidylyltransferase (CMP-KDO synthetase)
MVVRVARRVIESRIADRVLVATDDIRIAEVVSAAGIDVHVNSTVHFRSGSDRVAEATASIPAEIILNVQGDEPLVDGRALEGVLAALPRNDIGTVAVPVEAPSILADPDAVKLEIDPAGRATNFARDVHDLEGISRPLLHLGIYSFTRSSLERFTRLPASSREQTNALEQLRALEHGMTIGVRLVQGCFTAVNRPEDVKKIEALL